MTDENTVPIISANFSPLRFIHREGDKWEPTLEQINGRSYDYVKLHRLSTFVDVGIAPLSMGICFDGTLVLPALPQFRDPSNALEQFNRLLTEMLVGGLYCEAVTPDDIGYGSMTFTAYARIHGGGPGPSACFHRAARTKHIGTLDVISLLQPEAISTRTFQESIDTGRLLLKELGEIPREQVLYGTTFYVRKQWAESLIHLWTVTERLIELSWDKHVVRSIHNLPAKRRDFLRDHRTWTASAKLEVLSQKGLLAPELYDVLTEVRKARNSFAHEGLSPGHEIATKALTSCFELASLCASDFQHKDLFAKLPRTVIDRCNPELFPKKTTYSSSEVSHWLELPPIPGDKHWGDREYEVIEELCLKPIDESPTRASRATK